VMSAGIADGDEFAWPGTRLKAPPGSGKGDIIYGICIARIATGRWMFPSDYG